MADSNKKQFSTRLIAAMRQHPDAAKPGTKWGVSSTALQRKVDASREMARRYLEGLAIPREDKIDIICNWLNIQAAWLRFGEGAMRPVESDASNINEERGSYNVLPNEEMLLTAFRELPKDQQDIILALLDSMTWGQQKKPFVEPPHPRRTTTKKESEKPKKKMQG